MSEQEGDDLRSISKISDDLWLIVESSATGSVMAVVRADTGEPQARCVGHVVISDAACQSSIAGREEATGEVRTGWVRFQYTLQSHVGLK